jgi:DNA mismatch endonuclease (patch repair protein)
MDTVSKEIRSRMMSAVRGKNTLAELEVRRRLFAMGFRYRLHAKSLPGKPDIVLPKHAAVVFVHGCFWHMHGCHLSQLPATRQAWWRRKLYHNRLHDREVLLALRGLGWRTLVVWECGFRRPGIVRGAALDGIARRSGKFLLSQRNSLEIPAVASRTPRRKRAGG